MKHVTDTNADFTARLERLMERTDFNAAYTCPLCRDTGYADSGNATTLCCPRTTVKAGPPWFPKGESGPVRVGGCAFWEWYRENHEPAPMRDVAVADDLPF